MIVHLGVPVQRCATTLPSSRLPVSMATRPEQFFDRFVWHRSLPTGVLIGVATLG